MQISPKIITASALIASVSAFPLFPRSTCGVAPTGSGSQTPLSQPSGITTAILCQAQCDSLPSCLSFLFGLVDNTDECILYSVAASTIPPQSSSSLVAYDKACTSVPTIVPTASNPTGANPNKLAVRDTCGAAPAGSGSQTPLSQPIGITTAALCQTQCDSLSSCLSFLFGLLDGVETCMLYSVAASSVPAPSSGNFFVYDKACTSVPAIVPTTANPTGVNIAFSSTGSGSGTGTGSNTGSGITSSTPTGGNPAMLMARNTCGVAPTGPTGNSSPIATLANIETAPLCKARCQADASCQSFEFGTLTSGGSPVCQLFSVPAANVPAPTSGQGLVVYDVGCSL